MRTDKNNSEKNKDAKYNFLMYVPEIKHDTWEVNDEGRVVLYFKVNDPIKRFAGWLVKKNPNCDMTFDEPCSDAWLMINGENSIYDIVKVMQKKYNDSTENAIYRLTTYMKFLSKRGWITFKKVKEEEENQEAVSI